MKHNNHPLVLTILDGWGINTNRQHNAIAQADTPNWDRWWQQYPHAQLVCAGETVGLPAGQMGNSEVGHMHIGAGRTITQNYSRINQAIINGEFTNNPVFLEAIKFARDNNHKLHILGLLSAGGVHSHNSHIHALIKLAHQHNCHNLYVHAFLDGRDTAPKSATQPLTDLQNLLSKLKIGTIASICGRFYAMDRDKRWSRTQQAYEMLTSGRGFHAADPLSALQMAYARNETDEFVQASAIYENTPHTIDKNDVVIFMNFRADRARQLTQAFTITDFHEFTRTPKIIIKKFITLTQYATNFNLPVAYPPQQLTNTLGEFLAKHKYQQLRITETEKYAHVTFFFNGGHEQPYPFEDRCLIPSPKVATYDLQPQMSAPQITEQLIQAINSQKYAVIICNFANADMLGHTGNFAATINAINCLDVCLGKIYQALQKINGEMLITADHGNAEAMYNETTNQPHTAHTNNPVPLLFLGRNAICKPQGSLVDIAPSMIYLLGLEQPQEMTGTSLIELT